MNFTETKRGVWTAGDYRISRFTPQSVMGFRYRAQHNSRPLGTKESLYEAKLLCAEHARSA